MFYEGENDNHGRIDSRRRNRASGTASDHRLTRREWATDGQRAFQLRLHGGMGQLAHPIAGMAEKLVRTAEHPIALESLATVDFQPF